MVVACSASVAHARPCWHLRAARQANRKLQLLFAAGNTISGTHTREISWSINPDAELSFPDGRTVAVEVERSAKTPGRAQATLYVLAARYAGTWYFCPKATSEPMKRALAQLDP